MTIAKATAVYIDGYNLYYGRIRGTAFKWLDVVALFDRLLHDQDPTTELLHVRYFTAPALGRFATNKQASEIAQTTYLRALAHTHPQRFTTTLGKHSWDKGGTLLAEFVSGQPYDRTRRVRVWKLEEKQTDVNLALAMYRDAASGRYQQLVVCSNDSDIAPALAAIREDFPTIVLGMVTPRRPPVDGEADRRVSVSLSRCADWIRHYILDDELAAAQLPERVRKPGKPIDKPGHW
ncbi:NYN domain-containing protein (plasmid) [Xanthomonas axonopodis pv. ricini]|uniref:NYN domain-containing protein n=1 Tax=Xanthomonas TaxID=338 RepID=UPI002367BD32|nr:MULTISPECIES: NYN domain-containing protein [Xanthomonas]MDH4910159.1 NYN domain-containing protein [Xanthomonas euvesicatoria]WDN24973.1 NYN domain-containing protein [Xanthomonas oryzae]